MKNVNYFLLALLSASLVFAACDSDEGIIPEPEPVITEEFSFNDGIIGYGWTSYREYPINPITGMLEEDVYHRDAIHDNFELWEVDGGSPQQYFFGDDEIKEYIWYDAGPASCFVRTKCVYNNENKTITCEASLISEEGETIPRFTVESLEGDVLTMIKYMGKWTYLGRTYDKFERLIMLRMTPDELEKANNGYNKDYTDILSKL